MPSLLLNLTLMTGVTTATGASAARAVRGQAKAVHGQAKGALGAKRSGRDAEVMWIIGTWQ